MHLNLKQNCVKMFANFFVILVWKPMPLKIVSINVQNERL
jgi:hypothetical protein